MAALLHLQGGGVLAIGLVSLGRGLARVLLSGAKQGLFHPARLGREHYYGHTGAYYHPRVGLSQSRRGIQQADHGQSGHGSYATQPRT